MNDIVTLAASSRESVGKGTARAVRRNGQVPAVIYGDKKPPVSITIEEKILVRYANGSGFFSHLFDIELDGKKLRVLPRDIQFHPVTDRPLHVDFLRIAAGTKVKVSIPISFINHEKSAGLKRGGTLNVVKHDIEVLCAPAKIPEKFEISLEGYEIGDPVHLSSLKLPEDVTLTTKEAPNFTIASIAIPSAVRSEGADKPAEGEETAATDTKDAEAKDAKAAPAANAPAGKK